MASQELSRGVNAILIDGSVTGEAMLLPAIHLESDIDAPRFTAGDHTFYGSITVSNPGSAIDCREPLPTTYISRNQVGETSDLIVWREAFSTHDPLVGAECGTSLPAFPLPQAPNFAFDEEENPVLVNAPIPLMTQRAPLTLPAANAAGRGSMGGTRGPRRSMVTISLKLGSAS